MPFQILIVDEDKMDRDSTVWHDANLLTRQEFESAKYAQERIDAHKRWAEANQWTPIKLRIKKIVTAAWEDREAKRLEDGTYTPLPTWWLGAWWWRESPQIHRQHYAHMSAKDPSKIAFTESPEKGEADIQLAISPTAYLARFFGSKGAGILSDRDIRSIGAQFSVGEHDLKISYTPEDFERVYEAAEDVCADGSDYTSCMRYKRDHFGTPNHPAYAYGAGDLAIAWIEDDERSILGRAVIWPEKKTYVRVYGLNANYQQLMHNLLRAQGYSHESDFIGAKIMKILVEDEDGDNSTSSYYLMPYIDGRSGQYIKDHGDHFIICGSSQSRLRADQTEGTIEIFKMVVCAKTGREVAGNDVTLVDGQIWSNDAVYCHNLEYCDVTNMRTAGRVIRVIREDGYRYRVRESIFNTLNTYRCELSGDWVDATFYAPIEVHTPNGVQTWGGHLRSSCRRSRADGRLYSQGYYPDRQPQPQEALSPAPFDDVSRAPTEQDSGTVTLRYTTPTTNLVMQRAIGTRELTEGEINSMRLRIDATTRRHRTLWQWHDEHSDDEI